MTAIQKKTGVRAVSEQVQFLSERLPGLPAGTYTLSLDEHVNLNGGQGSDVVYSTTRAFQITGPRFSLPADQIHAVFPPERSTGPYTGSLPQVVFDRAMLPWIRTMGPDAPDESTWLALLLFDDNGGAPAMTKRKMRDLVPTGVAIQSPGQQGGGSGSLPGGYLSYFFDSQSSCTLEYGEGADDDITTIDIAADQFKTYVPAAKDMAWTAHVRQVSLANRSAHAGRGGRSVEGDADVGDFAGVFGNRILTDGAQVAYLVSLEKLGDYLPGGSKSNLDGISTVRLVALKQWSFSTVGADDSVLLQLLEHACDDSMGGVLGQPRIPGAVPTSADVDDALNAQKNGSLSADEAKHLAQHAFAMGYVPLAHNLRTGDVDVSWYRGPFAPVAVTGSLSLPLNSMDAALRYNPYTGMFDVSYAAAWQLGQLLALADNGFSAALWAWKRDSAERQAASRDSLSNVVDGLQAIADSPGSGDAGAALSSGESVAALFARIIGGRFTGEFGRGFARGERDAVPDKVSSWLNGLKTNMRGIPLHYLLPDRAMSPSESVRFFHVDINWFNALIDGACSIVRPADGGEREPPPCVYPPESQGRVTGCLVNGSVILNWPGLKIQGYSGAVELNALVDDTLDSGLRVLLFDGVLDSLVISEPAESLHFGGDVNGKGLDIALRYLQGDNAGAPIPDSRLKKSTKRRRDRVTNNASFQTASAVMRNPDLGIIDLDATANQIKGKLVALGEFNGSTLNNAQFALEMVKGTVRVRYEIVQQ